MLCQRCMKRAAQFHSYRIINNELIDIHLCSQCIENNEHREEPNSIDDKLHSLLDVLLESNTTNGNSKSGQRCEDCGTSLAEIEKTGLAGCPRCYDIFSQVILKGSEKNYVLSPALKDSGGGLTFLDRLETRLQKAVEREDFEEAAKIRDKIQNLEEEGFYGDS
jgi:protein arginine kinase activator